MVSSTQQSTRIRRRKATTNGKANKRERRANGTPAFPIHFETAASPVAAAAAPSAPVASKK